MNNNFSDALNWHMETEDTRISELVLGSGVSRDVINKLKSGSSKSTTPENAVQIAKFYGKSVEAFMALSSTRSASDFEKRFNQLHSTEQDAVEALIEGFLQKRGKK